MQRPLLLLLAGLLVSGASHAQARRGTQRPYASSAVVMTNVPVEALLPALDASSAAAGLRLVTDSSTAGQRFATGRAGDVRIHATSLGHASARLLVYAFQDSERSPDPWAEWAEHAAKRLGGEARFAFIEQPLWDDGSESACTCSEQEVDHAPEKASGNDPTFSEAVQRAGVPARMLLRVLVTSQGQVTCIRGLRLAYPASSRAAVVALQTWRFRPALKDGVAVSTWMDLPLHIRFR